MVAEAWDNAVLDGAVTGHLEQWPARDRAGVVAAARDKMTPIQLEAHTAHDEGPWMWLMAGILGFFGVATLVSCLFGGAPQEQPQTKAEPVVDDPVQRWMAARPQPRVRNYWVQH
jgi:hypothetical protein